MKNHFFFTSILMALSSIAMAQGVAPPVALSKMIDGNQRYANDELLHPRQDMIRRESLLESQHPFAIVLGCSDSRVPPEIIFDQGVGDLFIVRVAGNVAGPVELDSIEFAVLTFHSSLIVVLGHENCGAVKAVMDGNTADVENVASLIRPALENIDPDAPNALETAIQANVNHVVTTLKKSAVLAKLMGEGKLRIVGGYYNLQTGMINLLEPAKSQSSSSTKS